MHDKIFDYFLGDGLIFEKIDKVFFESKGH